MITRFRAQNYGCIRDVTLELTPIHALIGPNDSGKSTLLNGLRTLAKFADAKPVGISDARLQPRAFLSGLAARGEFSLTVADNGEFNEQGIDFAGRRAGPTQRNVNDSGHLADGNAKPDEPQMVSVLAQMAGARLIRFDPDALRSTSGLIPESQSNSFVDDRGQGLPGVYQAIQGRGDDTFRDLSERVRRLFPTVRLIRVTALTTNQLEMQVELTDGSRIRANQMSEGLLYFLAFAALPALAPTAMLLVEEPENGLHPSRIADVMMILREISQKTQVVIATHSPLVINCLQPNEVTVVTRPSLEVGTQATLIRNTPNFEKRSSVYALGELWLSYADGDFEAPLLVQGVSREGSAGG